jgi:hypothetical protein
LLAEPLSEIYSAFLFNPIEDTLDCRLTRPSQFYNPTELSAARQHIPEYRKMGYCPLHRHPDIVKYIETLTSLYGGQLAECLRVVDLDVAKRAANSIIVGTVEDPSYTMMEVHYEYGVIEPDMAINRGMWKDFSAEDCIPRFLHVECKGDYTLLFVN